MNIETISNTNIKSYTDENLQAKSMLFRLLSVFYYMPEPDMKTIFDNFSYWAEYVNPDLTQNILIMEKEYRNSDLSVLQAIYSETFVGPFSRFISPYATMYLDKENNSIMNDYTLDLINMYAAAGFEVEAKDGPDHIAIELEFVHALLTQELQGEAIMDADYFYNIHLKHWLPKFLFQLQQAPTCEYYHALGRLTAQLVPLLAKTI